MLQLTWPAALTWRLGRHLLEPVGSTSAADVVGALGAVAAQLDPASAELGVRTRRRRSAAGDVARALEDGTLLRTFAFRGAVHLMRPQDAGVPLALRALSRMWERPSWQSQYALTPADWPVLRAAVREALASGPMTRAELAAAVGADARFRHLTAAFTDPSATFLKPMAWQGDLTLGSARDGQMTLRSLEGHPGWTGLPDPDEAGPQAIESYLRSYGPSSVENLRYWLAEGLGVRRSLIPRWLAQLGDRVSTVDLGGEQRMVLRDDLDGLAAARPTDVVRLLPRYDQWVLGPGTADDAVVPPVIRPDVSRGADLVVVGGVVAGTWSLTGDTLTTAWGPGSAGPRRDDLDAEITRLAAILDRPLTHEAPSG